MTHDIRRYMDAVSTLTEAAKPTKQTAAQRFVQTIQAGPRCKHCTFEVEGARTVLLTWIEGGGGLVPYLTQIADKLRVKLTLMVEVVDTAYGGKLVRYYEKNGFEIKESDFDDDFDFMTMEPDPSDEMKGQVYMEREPVKTLGESAAAPRTGPGWQPVSALVSSAYSALDDMGEEELERFEASSPWRKVAYRYLSADCDNFAVGLHRVTNWPIVGNAAHRLVRGPRGLIDASGWTTEAKLQRRYRQWWQTLGEPGGEATAHSHMIGDIYGGIDELLAEVISAIRQFPWAPYNTRAFQQMSFRPIQGVDEALPGYEDEDDDE